MAPVSSSKTSGAAHRRRRISPALSAHQRTLKVDLKLDQRTALLGKYRLEMFNALQQWVGLRAFSGLCLAGEPRKQLWKAQTQSPQQVVKRLQREWQAQGFDSRFD